MTGQTVVGIFSSLVATPARTRLIKELTKHRIASIPTLDSSTRRELLKLAEKMTLTEAMSLPEANLCMIVESYAQLRRKAVDHSRALLLVEAHRSRLGSTRSVAEMDLVEYLAYRLTIECEPTHGVDANWFAHTVTELASHYQVIVERPTLTRCMTPMLLSSEDAEVSQSKTVDPPPNGPLQRYVFNCPNCVRALQAELPPAGRSVTCSHCRETYHSSGIHSLRKMPT